MARKIFGANAKITNIKAKVFKHNEKTLTAAKSITKEKAESRTSDSSLVSGSIVYNLTVSGSTSTTPTGDKLGNNFISYPFVNPANVHIDNGEDAIPKCGCWTPEELDKAFNYKLYAIYGEQLQGAIKTNGTGSVADVTGSWIGPLSQIWPWQAYWVKVTGSANVKKTITKQLIPPDVRTHIRKGWNSRAWPYTEFNRISASGVIPAGNDHNIIDSWITNGSIIHRLKDYEGESYYYPYAPYQGGQGTWYGDNGAGSTGTSFTFKTGSGCLAYYDGHQGTRFGNLFRQYASSGSDEGEGNDDTGSDNYYTGSSDVCIGSGSNYIDTPISNGSFIPGEGGGTFQVYPSTDMYTIFMAARFTGSGGIMSSSILNHDNTQMVTPAEWGTPTGSIAVGMYNLSGSNASNYGTAAAESGSVDDDSVCFGSAMFPSHPDVPSYYQLWFQLNPQLKYTTVSGSVSGSESQVANYPTGSNQTSSLKVYSPKCGQVYMARFYEFTASKSTYSLTDIQNAKDVTGELTGSKSEYKNFDRHFIKLRNDVI